jgi:cytidylate kinase
MYRAITWVALHQGVDLSDEAALAQLAHGVRLEVGPSVPGSIDPTAIVVDGEDVTTNLRKPEVEAAVSLVSRISGVRRALVRIQRHLADNHPVVMAGRDIGTVVLPRADLKVYLDASVKERAKRRHSELMALGQPLAEAQVLRDLRRRDAIDSQRSISPLRPAQGAIILETDGLALERVVEEVLALVYGSVRATS